MSPQFQGVYTFLLSGQLQTNFLNTYTDNTIVHFIETRLQNIQLPHILLKQDYKIYNCHSNKNTDGLVNRFASNMVILNKAHREAWLIG